MQQRCDHLSFLGALSSKVWEEAADQPIGDAMDKPDSRGPLATERVVRSE